MDSSYLPPHDYDLEKALPYLLNRAGVLIGHAFSHELDRFSLTLPMWRVLASLAHKDRQRMTELSEHTTIEISTLSRLVAALEAQTLVKRTASSKDRRAVVTTLTPRGRNMVGQIVPLAELYERVALANIPAEEIELLKRLLGRVYANVASSGLGARAGGKK